MITKKKSKLIEGELIAMAASVSEEPTNEQVMDAIDVLRRSGVNISVSPSMQAGGEVQTQSSNIPSAPQVNPSAYINPEYETINMMLGNGNNNNNDPMMNMLPYMLNANNEGKNIDPQIIQTLMMNSMMNGLSGLNSTDNK